MSIHGSVHRNKALFIKTGGRPDGAPCPHFADLCLRLCWVWSMKAEPEPEFTDMSPESHQKVMLLDKQKLAAKMAMVWNPSSHPTLDCHWVGKRIKWEDWHHNKRRKLLFSLGAWKRHSERRTSGHYELDKSCEIPQVRLASLLHFPRLHF